MAGNPNEMLAAAAKAIRDDPARLADPQVQRLAADYFEALINEWAWLNERENWALFQFLPLAHLLRAITDTRS